MNTALNPTSFIANNSTLRAFEIDGLLHPVKPIAQLIPVSIYNLEADKTKEISLVKYTSFDLLVVNFRADIKEDDERELDDVNLNSNSARSYVKLRLHILEQGKVVEALESYITSYPSVLINPLVLPHDRDFQIKVNKDINKLTFFCEPVYLLPAIDINIPNLDSNEDR